MGLRGPAPKPTILKLVAGNPGKRQLNLEEPVPPGGAPDPPSFLDQSALEVWNQLVPRLAASGMARTVDGLALGRYCALFVQWREAVAFVRANGPTYAVRAPGRGKKPGRVVAMREFPQNAELRKLSQLLLAIEREFGLTPAARTRIRLRNEKDAGQDVNEFKRRFFAGTTAAPAAAKPTTA